MNTLPFELDQKWLNNWLEALISGGHYTNHLGKRVYLHPQESLNSGERGYLADLLNLLFTDLLEYGKDNRKHSFEFSQNTHYQTLIGFMKSNWSRKLIELLETAIANNTQPWEVGTVFTPMALVQTMVKNSIDNWVRSQLGNENDLKTGNDLIQEIKLEKLNLELLKRIRTKLHDVKIIDNACGTGRFLEECANYLFDLDKMLRQFLGVHKANNDQAKWILQNNIHGMDINPLACNFARLRLNMWYVGKQITRKSRQIPQVPTHLYVGDTLVGGKTRDKVEELIDHNSYDGLTEQLDKHWHELFFEVFNRENPGFDIIVGNPPYISSSKMDASLGPKYKKFVNSLYNVPLSADLSVYFVLQSLSMLRSNGWHSYLITSKWMRAKYGKSIRDMIAKKTTIKDIIDITSLGIFDVATVDVIIYNLVNTPPSDNSLYYYKINSIKPLEFKKM